MLEARAISKQFGSVTALQDVSIQFQEGEIHAVLGENGAGKSTLMNVITGFVRPDHGQIILNGRQLAPGDPQACRAAGIEFVHQHFTLVPEFTVAENLSLAYSRSLSGLTDMSSVGRRATQLAAELSWVIDPDALVRDLSVGEMQRVEIMKCLLSDNRALVLDEPTAVLSPQEARELFDVLRKLAGQGRIVILIAHKLSEVLAVADRATVLRQGKVVGTAARKGLNEATLAEWMVGELPPLEGGIALGNGPPQAVATDLTVAGDRGETAVRGVSFTIDAGEILGIGGVDGNGQVELAEVLTGLREHLSGTLTLGCSGDEIAYIPQDRQREGLALDMTVEENLLIDGYRRREFNRRGWLDLRAIRNWCDRVLSQFEIKARSIRQDVRELSGGNQQKIVVSRALDRHRRLLVAVNPTRGLDIAATRYVRHKIREAAQTGTAVALFTTDFDELAELSSRALLMSRGQISEHYTAEAALGGLH